MQDSTDAELRQEILRLQGRVTALASDQERDAELAQDAANRLNLLEAMLEIVPVGVVLSDANGRIIMGNKAVEEMVGHPVLHSADAESYGEWVSFHEDGSRVRSDEYPLAKVVSEGVARSELDVNYQRGDGSKFWMRIIGQSVHDNSGERIGAVVALVDVDRERQLATQQQLLIGELNHRVKNAFSVVKSIVSMSLRTEDVPAGLRQKIDDRLDAYAKAHAKLVGSEWDHADLSKIVDDIVVNIGGDRVSYDGPTIDLPSRNALAVSMALYELATNAIKYGSLSVQEGTVHFNWRIDDADIPAKVSMEWVERGGPGAVSPTEKGFGSFIIDRALSMETGGEVEISYPSEGLRWHLTMPIA